MIFEGTTFVGDTETDGKRPRGRNNPLSSEPYMTQVAGILYQGRREVGHFSCFTKPVDPSTGAQREVPKEEFFINAGITDDVINTVGMPYKVALAMWNQFIKVTDRVVFHNVQFDDPIVRAAYSRIAAPQRSWWDTPKFCTMKTLEPIMKLPGKYGYKYPTLDEAYRAYVDPMGFDGAHDAMVDVRAAADVLWACEDNNFPLWKLPENWPKEEQDNA